MPDAPPPLKKKKKETIEMLGNNCTLDFNSIISFPVRVLIADELCRVVCIRINESKSI